MLILDKFTWFNVCRAGLTSHIQDNIQSFKTTRDEVHGATALMHACMDNNIEVVRLLLPYEDAIADNTGKTGLMIAAEHGYLDLVRLLAVTQARRQRETGQTALMHAAVYDFDTITEFLLPKEGKITDKAGWTALMYATWHGANKAAMVLAKIEAGMVNAQGETAFLCACDAGNYELAKLLFEKEGQSTLKSGETGLHLAARNGSTLIVEMLREKLCKRQTDTGKTALMYAAYAGHLNVIQLLIEYENGYRDMEGRTATMRAIQNQHENCMAILLPYEKDIVDNTGRTALDIAQSMAPNTISYHVAALLGGTVNERSGKTTLIEATQHGFAHIIRILIPKQTNIPDPTGMCAIHYAIANHDLECLQLLKQYEGTALNANGHHALIMAVMEKDINIVHSLQEYCWVPDANDTYVLSYCSDNPLGDIYQLLFSKMIRSHPNFTRIVIEFCKVLYLQFTSLMKEYPNEESVDFLITLLSLLSEVFLGLDDPTISITQLTANIIALFDGFTAAIYEFPCCICIDRPAFTILRPCMHMCVCNHCVISLRGRCPYCQSVIAGSFEICLDQ